LHQSDAKSSGARPGSEYWLTEAQCKIRSEVQDGAGFGEPLLLDHRKPSGGRTLFPNARLPLHRDTPSRGRGDLAVVVFASTLDAPAATAPASTLEWAWRDHARSGG
jgi:hypothetical protein